MIEAAPVWAIGIMEAKLTPKQISYGLTKALTNTKFCPDLPAFIALCKPSPEDMGLPSTADAYEEACINSHPSGNERAWSHLAVFHAAKQVGQFELRSLGKDITLPQFEAAYEKTVNAVLNGDELPEIPKALESFSDRPRPAGWKPSDEDRAAGKKAISGLMDMLK